VVQNSFQDVGTFRFILSLLSEIFYKDLFLNDGKTWGKSKSLFLPSHFGIESDIWDRILRALLLNPPLVIHCDTTSILLSRESYRNTPREKNQNLDYF
jgi:hypothetical protein